jgi:CheY-like chemotaxis protein
MPCISWEQAPVDGDQFEQADDRYVAGLRASHRWAWDIVQCRGGLTAPVMWRFRYGRVPVSAHTARVSLNKSVLIVDDDTSIRTMVRTVLHREGFEVTDVASGNDAIALLNEKPYDAVVLDVMMGDGSGHDVLEALASMRPAAKCVVVVSAASPASIEKVDESNVRAKLRKPFDIAALVEAIRQCLDDDNGRPSADARP